MAAPIQTKGSAPSASCILAGSSDASCPPYIAQTTWNRAVSVVSPTYTLFDKLKDWITTTALYQMLLKSRCIKLIKAALENCEESKTFKKCNYLVRLTPEWQKEKLEKAIAHNDFAYIRGVIKNGLLDSMQDPSIQPTYKESAQIIITTLYKTLENNPKKMQKLLSKLDDRHRIKLYKHLIKNKDGMVLITHLIPKLWHKHRTGKIEGELALLLAFAPDSDSKTCSILTDLWNNPGSWNICKAFVLTNSILFSQTSREHGLGQNGGVQNERYIAEFQKITNKMLEDLHPVQHTTKGRELITFIDTLQEVTSRLVNQRIENTRYAISLMDNPLLDQETEKITPDKLTELMERLSSANSRQAINDALQEMFGWKPLTEEQIRKGLLKTKPYDLAKEEQTLVIQDFMWRFFTSKIDGESDFLTIKGTSIFDSVESEESAPPSVTASSKDVTHTSKTLKGE
ncbi:hypothetical protein [Kistimonas asteriae]|uniref:hypothetical protein n=1 Tax=Kistimonas asteriae TaxID=517724 RepID=UPI001BAC7855|nr:hypothetical protein [Kistimonas asteriae]